MLKGDTERKSNGKGSGILRIGILLGRVVPKTLVHRDRSPKKRGINGSARGKMKRKVVKKKPKGSKGPNIKTFAAIMIRNYQQLLIH